MYVYLQIYNTLYIYKGIFMDQDVCASTIPFTLTKVYLWTKMYVYLQIYNTLYIDKGIFMDQDVCVSTDLQYPLH